MTHAPMINTGIKLIQSCDITNLVNNSSMPITQLWLEASHPRMLLIYAYCKGRSCKTLFLQWREYFVGITSSEVAAVLRKWRTEGQQTILRAGMIIDLSSTRSPPQPNPTQTNPTDEKNDESLIITFLI